MMADIFRRAEKTIVWLGAEDEFTSDALKVIRSIGQLQGTVDRSTVRYTSFYGDKDCYESLGISPLTYHNWLGFLAFINRPWFERAWVVQELALARSAILVCGSHVLPWEQLSKTLTFLKKSKWYHHLATHKLRHIKQLQHNPGRYRKLLQSNISVALSAIYLDRTRLVVQKGGGKLSAKDFIGDDFRKLIETHRFTKTTDPRDKIYAFLGLCNRTLPPFNLKTNVISPDYSTTVRELYTNVASSILLSQHELSLLSHVQDASWTSIDKLPSWVPDWSVPQIPYPLRLRGRPDWNASRDMFWQFDRASSELRNGKLCVQGVKIDNVENTAKLRSESTDEASFWSHIVSLALTIAKDYPISYSNGYQPSRFEVLWRTLMTNTYARRHPAPASCGQLFIDYVLNLQIRHQLVPWSADVEFQPHQSPMFVRKNAQWHALLSAEPSNSQFGLSLYESRFNDVVRAMFQGSYNPIGLAQLQHEIDHAAGSLRRVFNTTKGFLGTGAISLRGGDELWVLYGAQVPFILRKDEEGPNPRQYKLIGEAYCHGLMHGKGLRMGLPEQDIVLV
jgi:hypothetical protein